MKRLSVRLATVPARVDEGERRAAALEAAILQRAELKDSGAREDQCADEPTAGHKPARLGSDDVKRAVEAVSEKTEA